MDDSEEPRTTEESEETKIFKTLTIVIKELTRKEKALAEFLSFISQDCSFDDEDTNATEATYEAIIEQLTTVKEEFKTLSSVYNTSIINMREKIKVREAALQYFSEENRALCDWLDIILK